MLRFAENLDDFFHRLFEWSPRWLCDLAELSYGVPPECFGSPEMPCGPSRMSLWLYRVLR
jgi:hypothetical protein